MAARLRCRNSLRSTGRRPSGARLRNESLRRWWDPGGDRAPTPRSTTDEGNHHPDKLMKSDGWMVSFELCHMLLKGGGSQGDVSARINQDLTAERTFHIPVFQGQAPGNHEDRPSLERQHLPVTVSPGKYPQLRDLLLNLDIILSSGYWS